MAKERSRDSSRLIKRSIWFRWLGVEDSIGHKCEDRTNIRPVWRLSCTNVQPSADKMDSRSCGVNVSSTVSPTRITKVTQVPARLLAWDKVFQRGRVGTPPCRIEASSTANPAASNDWRPNPRGREPAWRFRSSLRSVPHAVNRSSRQAPCEVQMLLVACHGECAAHGFAPSIASRTTFGVTGDPDDATCMRRT